MGATLRQVLNHFEQQSGAVSLSRMARDLELEPPMLQEMINYWVRKGRLRQVCDSACTTCSGAQGCPFVYALPVVYELVTAPAETAPTARAESAPVPACSRCH